VTPTPPPDQEFPMTHQQLVDRHYAEINSNDFSDVAELFSS
jgi:hypothetical protein